MCQAGVIQQISDKVSVCKKLPENLIKKYEFFLTKYFFCAIMTPYQEYMERRVHNDIR